MKGESYKEVVISGDEPVFTTGVVSKLIGIPMWILKQLDAENVVSPPRQKGCSRLYSKKDLNKLGTIWFYMKEKKVNVHGVKIILEIRGNQGM